MRKERYFTSESLSQKAQELLDWIQHLRSRQSRALSTERAALLVLDMQYYFLDEASHAFIPSAEAVLPRIASLASAWSARHRPVVFTRHTNTTQDAGMLSVWWKDLIQPDMPGSAIASALRPETGVIIEKSQYDLYRSLSPGNPAQPGPRFCDPGLY